MLLAGLALLNEVGVLREAAGVEEHRDAVALTEGLDFAKVCQADRLAAAAVVGHGNHANGNPGSADAFNQRGKLADIQVAFEWMPVLRLLPFGNHQVERDGAGMFDVGAGGVKVIIAGNELALAADELKE